MYLHLPKAKTAESPSTVRISGGMENKKQRPKMCSTTDLTTYTTTIKYLSGCGEVWYRA